jgi:Cysteine-rich CPXCG
LKYSQDVDYDAECPGCGAWVVIFIDPGAGERQEFEETCPECGAIWTVVAVEEEPGGFAVGVARRED